VILLGVGFLLLGFPFLLESKCGNDLTMRFQVDVDIHGEEEKKR